MTAGVIIRVLLVPAFVFILIMPLVPPQLQAQQNQKMLWININGGVPSKLNILARKSGIVFDSTKSLPEHATYRAVFLWDHDAQQGLRDKASQHLSALFPYVKQGGTLYYVISQQTADQTLMDLFGIGVAREDVIKQKPTIIINGSALFSFWEGLKVYGYKAQVSAYLEVVGKELDVFTGPGIISDTTGKRRKIAAASSIGQGRVIAIVEGGGRSDSGYCDYCSHSMLDDRYYNLLDNEEAITRLLSFLLKE